MLDKKKIILETIQSLFEEDRPRPPRASIERKRGERRRGPRRFEKPPAEETSGQENVIAAMRTGNKAIIAAAIQTYLRKIDKD
jgi:hypothetical protein